MNDNSVSNRCHSLQLRFHNPEGDSKIGFHPSRYKLTEVSSEIDLSKILIPRDNERFFAIFCKQVNLMLKKNTIVYSRNLKPTLFLFSTPILICLLLLFLQMLTANFSQGFVNKDPQVVQLKNISKCVYPDLCTTIGYGVISRNTTAPEYVDKIMKEVAEANALNFGRDVKLLTIGNSSSFTNYLQDNMNKTAYGVVFCADSIEFMNISVPCSFEFTKKSFHLYTILYNVTTTPNGFLTSPSLPNPSDPKLTKLKIDIDNAFLKHYSEKSMKYITPPKINASLSAFPTVHNRFLQNADIVSSVGSFYFFFPPMICFVVILLEVIREKDLKLRKSLIIIGLNNSAFWLSWLITGLFFSFCVSFIMVFTGIICDFDVFTNTPFVIIFFLFFMFNSTMVFLSFFLSTILKSLKSAYTVSYGFILIGLVMELFLSNYLVIYSLYSTDLPAWVGIIKLIFELYPPFNFSKAFSDIANKSASHFDNQEWRWVKGPGYAWSDLFTRIKGSARYNIVYDVPSTGETFGFLLIDCFIYAVLAWYFDHVDSSNRGKSYSKFFFLEKSYWCRPISIHKAESMVLSEDLKADHYTKLPQKSPRVSKMSSNISSSCESADEAFIKGEQSVKEEKEKILKNEQDGGGFQGLRVIGCSKVFQVSNACCGTKDVHALKETYIEVPNDELFTLLGHNGAGKSTLINILTGNISPTSGTAKVNDSDLICDSRTVETLIGLCPQHDILWEELTAKEHIELYAQLRSIKYLKFLDYTGEDSKKLVELKLKDVNLSSQANSEVRTFSGGMKRRLSILLSTIGNPKVIFLDEPTTGLDPVNRRFIWSMIQKMKKQRSIILTTHSMEEADFLSDRIGVVVEGSFKCIGTSHELKNLFGSGYLLTFVCERDNTADVSKHIKLIMPSCNILNSSGGSIMLNLPFHKVNEMKFFISILNNKYESEELAPLKGLIKECGMNYTTLEEIFLKITSRKEESLQEMKTGQNF